MHFPRNENRFWKSSKKSSWNRFMYIFRSFLDPYPIEPCQSILQPEIFSHFAYSGFGIKFEISVKRYFFDEFHSSKCYRRHPVTMLNRQKFQCRAADNYVYRAARILHLYYVLTAELLGFNWWQCISSRYCVDQTASPIASKLSMLLKL